MARLFEDGSQVNTSSVSDSLNSARMYFRASMVCFDLLVDLLVVDHLLLIRRRRREEHDQIVPLLRRNFRGGPRRDFVERDVVHHDVDVVFLAPFFGEHAVEPLVVPRHEVTPLEDLQGLLLRRCSFRKEKERAGSGSDCQRAAAGKFDEHPPRKSWLVLLRHVVFLLLAISSRGRILFAPEPRIKWPIWAES